MRIVCIVGDSGVGKTTLIERLTVQPAFAEDRLGLLKRTHHRLDWHPPGKDSTRFRDTRAAAVAILDPGQTVCFWPREASDAAAEEDVARRDTRELVTACLRMGDHIDIVLAEGFTGTAAPKLWITRRDPSPERRGPPPVTRTIVTTPENIEGWARDFPALEVVDIADLELVARLARAGTIDVRRLARG